MDTDRVRATSECHHVVAVRLRRLAELGETSHLNDRLRMKVSSGAVAGTSKVASRPKAI